MSLYAVANPDDKNGLEYHIKRILKNRIVLNRDNMSLEYRKFPKQLVCYQDIGFLQVYTLYRQGIIPDGGLQIRKPQRYEKKQLY